MKLFHIVSATLLASHGAVFAAPASDPAPSAGAAGQAPRLGLGLGVALSSEVYAGEEFLGVVYIDDEDGDRSYNFSMAILDVDL